MPTLLIGILYPNKETILTTLLNVLNENYRFLNDTLRRIHARFQLPGIPGSGGEAAIAR